MGSMYVNAAPLLVLAPQRERNTVATFARQHLMHLFPRLENDDPAAQRLHIHRRRAAVGKVEPQLSA